jgi:hydroxyacylglutathione hydrolase
VGRPDLAIKTDLSREDLAGHLYNSLHNKILPLPDDVIVYPAHGAGSACGKNLGKETYDTLGHQRQVNYALQPMSKEDFIKAVTEGLAAAPQYFPKNAVMNKQGGKSLDEIMTQGMKAWGPQDFENLVESTGALVLDTRAPQVFAKGFVPGSVNIGIDGQFAPWVGALITDLTQPILLVCDEDKEEECVTRLARVGYDNTIGYLLGGVQAWEDAGKELDMVTSITATDFEEQFYSKNANVLDVRKPGEYETEHIENAVNKPLDNINDWTPEMDMNKTYYIHCAGGYRSMITASILKARGFHNIVEIAGGYGALKVTNLPRTKDVNQLS